MNYTYRFPVRDEKDLFSMMQRPSQQIHIPYEQRDLQYFLRHAPAMPGGWCNISFETGRGAVPGSVGMLWPQQGGKLSIAGANLGTELSHSLAGGRIATLRAYFPYEPWGYYERFEEKEMLRFPNQFKTLQGAIDELVKNGYRVGKIVINAMQCKVHYGANPKTGESAGITHLPRIHVGTSEAGNFLVTRIEDSVFDTSDAKAMRKVFDALGARKEHYSGYRSGGGRMDENLRRIIGKF